MNDEMARESEQKIVAVSVQAVKLTSGVLKSAMGAYLRHREQKKVQKHGKTTVKKLCGMDAGVSSIEITDSNIKSFEKVARKYNVDFAVRKDKSVQPPKYTVFFKGRDEGAISQAFKEYVHGSEKKKKRESAREKLTKSIEKVRSMGKQKSRDRAADRENVR